MKLRAVGAFVLALAVSTHAAAARGVVTHRVAGCDYFVVKTASSYSLLEWYGGNDPSKGDIIVGAFESYGMKDIFNVTSDGALRVWVEDFLLSRTEALEQLLDKCH